MLGRTLNTYAPWTWQSLSGNCVGSGPRSSVRVRVYKRVHVQAEPVSAQVWMLLGNSLRAIAT